MAAAALDRIEIQGYKSIREMSLDLRSLNVLIGANGAGKSNFISIFRFLNAMIEQKLQEFVARSGGANAIMHFGLKRTRQIVLKLEFGENLYGATIEADEADAVFFSREDAYVWDKISYPSKPYKVSLGTGQRESKLRTSKEPVAGYVRSKMSTWRLYHFHDTSTSALVKAMADIHNDRSLASDASNLAPYLLRLREEFPANYREIVDLVGLAAPFFGDFVLSPRVDGTKVRLEWIQKGSDQIFGPNDFSDGTLRFICLATALLQPDPPPTIIIDEPELGLHPYAITLLASLMRVVSQRMQVIVSTQSVPLVNQFEPDDLIVVDRFDGQSTFRRLENETIKHWLDDYGLGDLWEKNVLGGRPTHA